MIRMSSSSGSFCWAVQRVLFIRLRSATIEQWCDWERRERFESLSFCSGAGGLLRGGTKISTKTDPTQARQARAKRVLEKTRNHA